MSALLHDQTIVTQAYEKYQQFNRDAKLRALDEAHQRFLHDHATDIEEAQIKAKIEIARNMKNKGCTHDFITEMTGLTADMIEQLD